MYIQYTSLQYLRMHENKIHCIIKKKLLIFVNNLLFLFKHNINFDNSITSLNFAVNNIPIMNTITTIKSFVN